LDYPQSKEIEREKERDLMNLHPPCGERI